MKKTLADFKRDITVGTNIYCEKVEEAMLGGHFNDPDAEYGELKEVERKNGMLKLRTVTYKDTTGFYLATLAERESECDCNKNYGNRNLAGAHDTDCNYRKVRGSYCQFPKASELVYDGETFVISVNDGRGVWQRRTYKIID